ncbi:uncharacterized protein TM35_000012360, partial [Trypanosoma theileri]
MRRPLLRSLQWRLMNNDPLRLPLLRTDKWHERGVTCHHAKCLCINAQGKIWKKKTAKWLFVAPKLLMFPRRVLRTFWGGARMAIRKVGGVFPNRFFFSLQGSEIEKEKVTSLPSGGRGCSKENIRDRTRTCNPLIRSQMLF